MTDLEDSYRAFLRKLGRTEKELLEDQYEKEESVQRQVIEKNVRQDKEHLTIVNFVVSRFEGGSHIHAETGYAWVRVEPLFQLGTKNFDIAIYNDRSKVMILVECKSGLSDAKREIKEIQEKIQVATDNRKLLSELVGDDIDILEFAICLKAGLAPSARAAVRSQDVPCSIWMADVFGPILVLDNPEQSPTTKISLRHLHREETLRRRLLQGIKETSSTRVITFLPSSHMCSILEEIVTLLRLELDKNQNADSEFTLRDVETLMKREISVRNFDAGERKALAEKILTSGLSAGIFVDLSKDQSDASLKKLRLFSQARSSRQFVKDCHDKYVRHKARQNTLKKLLAETDNKQPGLEKFSLG